MRGVTANRRRTADTPNLAAQEQSVSRKTVAEVPLTGLSFGPAKGVYSIFRKMESAPGGFSSTPTAGHRKLHPPMPKLYQCSSLIDALREGRARERNLAAKLLKDLVNG
jgi:hypothetical protein